MKISECPVVVQFDYIKLTYQDSEKSVLRKIELCKPNYVFYEKSPNKIFWLKSSELLILLNEQQTWTEVLALMRPCEGLVDQNSPFESLWGEGSIKDLVIIGNSGQITGYCELAHSNFQLFEYLVNVEAEKKSFLDKMEQKDDFINILSHDIRNPIGIISVCCDYMLSLAENTDTPGSKNKYVEFIKRIKNNVKRSNMLVQSLLELGKTNNAPELSLEDVYLPDFIQMTVQNNQFLANSKSIELKCENLEEITAPIDQKKIQQIVENLTGNAIKFTERNKKIHFSLTMECIDEVEYACISVRDEGRGIPKDKLDTLFQKFSQGDQEIAKELGIGLGLFIIKQFTDLHNGKIVVDSIEGKGTTFTVKIPHAYFGTQSTPIDKKNSKVLVVDDDEDIRYLVQMIISEMGYDYLEAENGEEAFEKYKLHKPDLVISDIRMPKLDGLELLQKIKKDNPNVPCILMSGYYDKTEINHIKKVFHPELIIGKPFVKEEFRELLEQKFFS